MTLLVFVNQGVLSLGWIRTLRGLDQGQSAIGDVSFGLYPWLLVLFGCVGISYGQQWMELAVTGGRLLCLVLA